MAELLNVFNWRKEAGKVGKFMVTLEVANFQDLHLAEQGRLPPEKIRRLALQGLVDTGSNRLILPEAVIQQLGLPAHGKVRVRYGEGSSVLRDEVLGVYVQLLGRAGVFNAIAERNRETALIGAIVLEDLDFMVDCSNQKLIPRDPDYIVNEVD